MAIPLPRLTLGQTGTQKHLNAVIAAIETALNTTFTGSLPINESDVTNFPADLAAKAPLVIPTYTVATVPAAAGNAGLLIRVSDGAAGSPCLAVSDNTHWNRVLIGAAVSTT